jgi:hypothetical protein
LEAAPAGSPKQRQKRRVSSAAALTTVVPSGLWARCSTRLVCPVSSATLAMEGYFHRHSWFWLHQGNEGWRKTGEGRHGEGCQCLAINLCMAGSCILADAAPLPHPSARLLAPPSSTQHAHPPT